MKKIFGICVLFFIVFLTGCNSIHYKIIEANGEVIEQEFLLDEASKLEIKNITVKKQNTMTGANVEVHPGQDRKVIIKAQESIISRLNSKISFNTLKVYGVKNEAYACSGIDISIYGYTFDEINLSNACTVAMEEGCIGNEDIRLDISGASNLSVPTISGQSIDIDISGASSLSTDNCSGVERIRLDISGASRLTIKKSQIKKIRLDNSGASTCIIDDLQVESSVIDNSGASTLVISGNCDSLKLNCSGASTASFQKLLCDIIDASISGASHATVTFKSKLSGSVSGGSNIIYYGNSQNVDVNQSGGASLIAG